MKIERLKDSQRVYSKEEFESYGEHVPPQIMDSYMGYVVNNSQAPTRENLNKLVKKGELIYVDNYTRADGTKVSGYYRSHPKK